MSDVDRFIEFAALLDEDEWEVTEHKYPKDKTPSQACCRSIRLKQREGFVVFCFEFKDENLEYIDIGGIRTNIKQSGFTLGNKKLELDNDDLC